MLIPIASGDVFDMPLLHAKALQLFQVKAKDIYLTRSHFILSDQKKTSKKRLKV